MSLERELADCREKIVRLEVDKAYALKEIVARGAEIERLRGALRLVIRYHDDEDDLAAALQIAREALGE